LRTTSRVREQDSNKLEWVNLDHGEKDGLEVPLAAALEPGFSDGEVVDAVPTPRGPGQKLFVRGGELIIPPGTGIGVSDVLDLAEVVDETLSEQPIDTILGSELTRVLGIDDEQATRLAEAFGATTVQQLLRNPAFGRLLRLAQTVGVRPA
jgi:hypothetical protein